MACVSVPVAAVAAEGAGDAAAVGAGGAAIGGAAAAGGDQFVAVEAERGQQALATDMLALVVAAQSFCSVLDQCHPVALTHLVQGIEISRMAKGMHGHHRGYSAAGQAVSTDTVPDLGDFIEMA